MKTTIQAADLRAALTAISKEKTRPILTGVLIEVEGETTKVTATDSYRLVHTETSGLTDQEDGKAVIDLSGIKIPSKGKHKSDWVTIEHEDGEPTASLLFFSTGQRSNASVIEGSYPNYEQILPDSSKQAESITGYAFNSKCMADLGKAAQAWSGNPKASVHIEFMGETRPCYMRDEIKDRRFEGIVMPVRGFDKHLEQPKSDKGRREYRELIHENAKLQEEICKLKDAEKAVKEAVKEKVEVVSVTDSKEVKKLKGEVRKLKSELKVKTDDNLKLVNENLQLKHDARCQETEKPESTKTGYEELDSILAKFEGVKVTDDTKSCVWLTGIRKGTKAAEELAAIGVRKASKGKHAKQWYFSKPR